MNVRGRRTDTLSKLIGMLVVACCVAASCGSSNTVTVSELAAAGQADYGESPSGDWTAGVNAAGWDFHRHLHGNAASSPAGIGVAFSMARAGASAETAVTLDEIFAFPETGVHNAASDVMRELAAASAESVVLTVANRLFPDDGFVARSEFAAVRKDFRGDAASRSTQRRVAAGSTPERISHAAVPAGDPESER